MTIIHKTGSITVEKKDAAIYVHGSSDDPILTSLEERPHIIRGKNMNDDGTVTLHIRGVGAQTLDVALDRNDGMFHYQETLRMFIDIGTQCELLEKSGYVLPTLERKDVIVVDRGYSFFYVGGGAVPQLTKDTFSLRSPLHSREKEFASPELLNVSVLPYTLHRSQWIYSIGALCIFAYTGEKNIQSLTTEEHKRTLEMIEDTKLYFAILRCLLGEKERSYLFV